MPFLRFARDKRGVESFALVHTATNRRGKVRPRVLYWFRTPPDIKMGREPFDPAIRRALETQYPDITFDWRAIAETPIPSADAEKWRERRRAERAAKHAAAAEEAAQGAGGDESADEADPAAHESADADAEPEAEKNIQPVVRGDTDAPADAEAVTASAPGDPRNHAAHGKRRRRRRSGGGGGRGGQAPSTGAPASPPPSGGEPSGD